MRQMENYVAGGVNFRCKVKRRAYLSTGGRQTSISLCYSLIRFIWPRRRPTLPVGRVSCAWWMLLSKMPRSIHDACTGREKKQRERTYLFPKRLPCISFCNLTLRPCNNIRREDNCWERFLRLASKFYHGLTAPLNGATMSQSIQYVKGIRFWEGLTLNAKTNAMAWYYMVGLCESNENWASGSVWSMGWWSVGRKRHFQRSHTNTHGVYILKTAGKHFCRGLANSQAKTISKEIDCLVLWEALSVIEGGSVM